MQKKIGVITTSRADYSIYSPLLAKLAQDPEFELNVFVLGMHLSPVYGETINEIKKDGYKIIRGSSFLNGDNAKDVAMAMAQTTQDMAKMVSDHPMDLFICLGDRYEMMAAVSAVIPFNIPMAHIHGGETTEGAIDEKFRHAISKMADLHFATCEKHRQRIIQMGVFAEHSHNVGSLGVECTKQTKTLGLAEIKERYKIDLAKKTVLVTYHPVTTEVEKSHFFLDNLFNFLESIDYQVAITLGNADTYGPLFHSKIKQFSGKNTDKYHVFPNLGVTGYFSFMKFCPIVLGNSSSGIIEAASFNLPVVNIGNRQKGRECSENVVHSKEDSASIAQAFTQAEKMVGRKFSNIYEKENTSSKIVEIIKKFPLKTVYRFNDLNFN